MPPSASPEQKSAQQEPQTFQELSKEDQENLQRFINSIILREQEIQKQPETIEEIINQKENDRDYITLVPMIQEFLKSFIVIGYTIKGDRVLLTYAKNQEQQDSLLEQLRLVFIHLMNKSGGNGPD